VVGRRRETRLIPSQFFVIRRVPGCSGHWTAHTPPKYHPPGGLAAAASIIEASHGGYTDHNLPPSRVEAVMRRHSTLPTPSKTDSCCSRRHRHTPHQNCYKARRSHQVMNESQGIPAQAPPSMQTPLSHMRCQRRRPSAMRGRTARRRPSTALSAHAVVSVPQAAAAYSVAGQPA